MEKPAHKLPSEQVNEYEKATKKIKTLQMAIEEMSELCVVSLVFEGEDDTKTVNLIEHFHGVISEEFRGFFKEEFGVLIKKMVTKMVERREEIYRE